MLLDSRPTIERIQTNFEEKFEAIKNYNLSIEKSMRVSNFVD